MSSVIDVCSSSDDELPPSSGLKVSSKKSVENNNNNIQSNKRQFVGGTNTYNNQHTSAATAPSIASSLVSPTPNLSKKKAKTASTKPNAPNKVYTLIWVCTHGRGRNRSWRKKDLKIVGVYGTKIAAEEAKRNIMNQYECCGHGDILVGGSWDDEIDLVIRDSPLHL